MEEKHIEEIIALFKKVGVWNNGKFAEEVEKYCAKHNLPTETVHSKLAIAFRDYLATNIKSEAAIRLRLSQQVKTVNVAL